MSDPKPILAYVRQSMGRINENANDALSLEAQEDAIYGWAERNGYRVTAVVRDHDEVGRSMQRPGLQELRDRIAPGQAIAVWKYDRLARNLLGQEQVVQEIEGKGASVISTTEPSGKFARQMLGTVAEYYSDQLSERLQSVTLTRVKRGQHVGATPYGYDRPGRLSYVDKRGVERVRHTGPLIPHETEAPHVVWIFDRWLAGDSLRKIANELNTRGVPSPTANGWVSQTIAWMLHNPVYAGGVRIKSLIVWDATHAPLIAQHVWHDAQTRFTRVAVVRSKTHGSWCEELTYHACGQRMLMNMVSRPGGGRYPSFRCSSAARVGIRRCGLPRQHIGVPLLEKAVLACLRADLASIRPLSEAIACAATRSGSTEVETLRSELEAEREEQIRIRGRLRVAWAAEKAQPDLDEWNEMRAPYDEKIAEIERRIAALPVPPDPDEFQRAVDALRSFRTVLDDIDDAVRRQIVTELGRILIEERGVRIQYWPRYQDYVPDPVVIDPRV